MWFDLEGNFQHAYKSRSQDGYFCFFLLLFITAIGYIILLCWYYVSIHINALIIIIYCVNSFDKVLYLLFKGKIWSGVAIYACFLQNARWLQILLVIHIFVCKFYPAWDKP